MFRIKICGITDAADAALAEEAGADAIGLNFYRPSPRFVEAERAREIVDAVGNGTAKVGLFVNEQPEKITATCDSLGLDFVQLHGDEPPELIAELGERPVIRAFRCGDESFAKVLAYLDRCETQNNLPQVALIDAHQPGLYGGTGKTANWQAIAQGWDFGRPQRLILAGGLTVNNVAQAIAVVRPDGVDVSSGVESTPGKKNPKMVREFVAAAQAAFQRIGERERGGQSR